MKRALIVRGGWEGHSPKEATDLFIPFLREAGFDVRIEDSTKIYVDSEYMSTTDLIVQSITMGEITADEFSGLHDAITNGTGFAGWHGGITFSFPNTAAYVQMIGGLFVGHPGKSPEKCVGDETDYFVPHTYNFSDLGREHEITGGISDFDLVTEQYWVVADPYIQVLATTTQKVRPGDPWTEEITSPAIWTRKWGNGKIFVITCGHNLEILLDENVHLILQRGFLWASR
jgi:type 1 glutamine amidotransferase